MKYGEKIAVSININSSADKVWKVLTTPALIKEWLFGTEAISDWKEGSSLIYRGVWEGKSYEEKGTIRKIIKNELLDTLYYSPSSGMEDKIENYMPVIYKIDKNSNGVTLTISQENIENKEKAEHSKSNWIAVLQLLKKVAER